MRLGHYDKSASFLEGVNPSFGRTLGVYTGGYREQRGRGIFGTIFRGLGSLFRRAAPLAKRALHSKIVKDVAATALEHGAAGAAEMAADAVQGINPKESIERQLTSARKDIASTIRAAGKRPKRALSPIFHSDTIGSTPKRLKTVKTRQEWKPKKKKAKR